MKERRYIIIPLHSTLTGDEQSKVFHKPGAGDRKIILSTNIAESSITVPDIKYVIDFCLTKNLECDQDTNYSQLKLQWASKANCKQRKGRAGRVANGRVYRMVSTDFYDSLQDYTTPEMQRCPLDSLILQVKLLDLGEPKAILGLALSPPNLDDIERTILVLKEVGALSTIRDGGENIHDGDLTFMGRVLASLPVDIRLGKLILLGYVFGCLSDCIIIAASLAVRTFFAQPFKSAFEAYRFKLSWSGNPLSDSIALLNAYTVWNTKTSTGYFRTTTEEARWGRDNFLQIRRLKEVRDLVEELEKRLHKHNIVTPRQPASQRHQGPMDEKTKQEKWLILKVVMCGAFYPNFFTPSHIDEEQAIRDLSGKNPATTVWVKGLPSNAGHMYKSQIQNLFHVCDQAASRPKVHFEQSRAYIEFQRDPSIARHHSCRVLPAVYFALKLRLIKTDLTVEIVHNHEEVASSTDARNPETAKNKNALKSPWNEGEHGDGQSQEPRHVPRPTPNQTVVPVYVTEVISPDSFWVYFADPFTWEALRKQQEKIAKELDTYESLPAGRVRVSTYCLAPYIDDGMCYYRARIHSIEDRNRGGRIVKVFFLDYGNVDTCSAADLKVIPKEIFELPFQAVSCSLAQLKPSPLKCPNGEWTKEAIECFRSKVQAKRDLRAKIYSIVDECLRVELFETPNGQRQIDINQELIDLRYALKADESFISKMSNRQRDEEALLYHAPSEQHIGNGDGKANNLKQAVEKKQRETAEFGVTKKGHKVVLAGPWSPLEVSVHSMAHIGRLKQSRIEQDSLNCVLLDEEPQLKCTSLVVAAHVSLSQSGTEMRLRQTTVMPKIPGLPALVAMLFAPKAELRTDDTYSAYTGVLCGLGYDEENDGPALPDHDMEISFDTEFDREDLRIINKVRVAVNLALEPESQHVAELDESSLLNIQRQSCQLLLQLLQRERKAVEIKPTCYSGEWNVVDPDRVLAPMMTDMLHVLYHLHNGIELAEDLEEEEDEEEAKEVYPPQSAGRGVGRGRGIVGQSAARNNNVPPPPVGYHSQQQGGGGYSQKSQMYNQPQYQNNGAYSQQQTQGREHNPPKQFRPSHSQPQQQNPRSQQNQQIPPRYQQQQQQNQPIPHRYQQQQQQNQQIPPRYQLKQQQNQQIPPRYQQQQNQQQWTQQQNQQFPRYQNQQQQQQKHSSFVAPGSQPNNTRPAALSLQNTYTPSHNPPSQHMAPNYPPLSMRHQAPAAQRYPAAASTDNLSDSDSSGSYYSVGRGKQRKKVVNTQQPKKQTQPPPPSHLVTLEPPQLPPPPPQQQVSMAAVTPSAAAAPGINAAADAHIRELHRMANTSEEPWDVECKVCRKMTNSPKELMLHLQTRLHKMREDIIYGKK